MKKKIKYIFLALIFLPCLIFMSACEGVTVDFKINFVVDDVVYDTIETSGNTTITMPNDPTKDGYTFDGWYWDKDVWNEPFTANSLLNTPLKKDMNVYAKFSIVVAEFQLQYENDEVILTAYNGSSENVVIPATITKINENVFSENTSIKTVTFENNSQCTMIGARAFANCTLLTNVIIPESVIAIGERAFVGCIALETVTFEGNSKCERIEAGVFQGCIALANIEIPEKVVIIENSLFTQCKSLTSITISENVTSIGSGAFLFCDHLTSITFEGISKLENIENSAFRGCTALTSVYYAGSESDWEDINIANNNSNLSSATRYYYSEEEPTDDGNYWHYDDDNNLVIW